MAVIDKCPVDIEKDQLCAVFGLVYHYTGHGLTICDVIIIPTLGSLKFRKINIYSVQVLATAFVLINAEIGSESEVLKGLKEIGEVKEAHMVYGVYDIIARIQTETMQELKDIISWKIRRLDKVRSTLTMIVV